MSSDPARMIAKSARMFEDPAERAAYLDRVCHGIARLRADVERILAETAADEPGAAESPTPDEAPAREDRRAAAPAAEPEPAADDGSGERAGATIGRYRLVRQLGEGGFGTVWLAEQFQPVRREVALKIIKLGMDTLQVVARFEQERQALALMDHPNVARVLDAGATASGRPYFVMDLVQGEPIHEYCDREKLSVAARLELFAQVCTAVQHAHRKGIIHRDLKPSNVLVSTRDGKPHATVIDFGIAKATSSKLTDRSLVTEAYQVIGTLQYMSPEQSQASPDIDTRTDVYSLGVILYELLTGTTPYDSGTLERAALAEILRMISEEDPAPPSARITQSRDALPALAATRSVDVRRLAASLRGDLDWIVMRAIEKDRDRRYESAEAFAADIRRHLAGEEVLAAPPSGAYRLRKFVRRHRGPVAAAAAVAATLVAGVVAFAWQAGVARDERDAAVKAREAEAVERRRAEAAAGFMETVFDGINPSADEGTAGSLRDQLVGRLDQMAAEFPKLDGDPVARARLETSYANTMAGLGEYDKARAAYQSARDLLAAARGPDHPSTEESTLSLAYLTMQSGRFDEALRLVEQLRDARLARGPLTEEQWIEVDEAFGGILAAAGRHREATAHLEAACRRIEALGGPDTSARLQTMSTLGVNWRDTGRHDDAVRLLTDVYERRVKLLGPDATDTLMTANSLAVALSVAKRTEEAALRYQDTRDRVARRFAPDHPMTLIANLNLSGALIQAGRTDEGVRIAQEQTARAVARHGNDASITLQVKWGLATALSEANRSKEAVAAIEDALGPMSRVWGPEHEVVRGGRRLLAKHALTIGAPERARAFLEAEIARVSAADGLGGPDGAAAVRLRAELGSLRVMSHDFAGGAAMLEELIPGMQSALGATDDTYLSALHDIGYAHFQAEKAKDAIPALDRAWKARSAALGEDHPKTLESQHALGSAHWLAREFPRAVEILTDTLARCERALGPDDDETLRTALDLGFNLLETGRKDKFLALMADRLPRAQAKFGLGHDPTVQISDAFAGLCVQAEREADAAPALQFLADALREQAGPDHPDALRLAGNAAACWWRAGRLDRSVPVFEDLVPRLRRVVGAGAPQTLQVAANLGVNLRDAQRVPEALAILEETMRTARSGGPATAQVATFAATEYARTLAVAGRGEDAARVAAELVEAARRQKPAGSPALANDLVGVTLVLLDARQWQTAESVLREVVAIREKAAPDAWGLFNARALLGEALLGQARFAEAEPLVIGGCEGLLAREKAVPPPGRHWIPKAKDRVLRLYAAWETAEPGKGHEATRSEWEAKFSAGGPR